MSPYTVPAAAAVLVVFMGALMRLKFTGQRFVRPGGVTGIVGHKGSGKSLFLVHEMLRAVGRKQRCTLCEKAHYKETGQRAKITHHVHVASNNAITLPAELQQFFVLLPDDPDGIWNAITKLPHLTISFIDELGVYAPAEPGFKLSKTAKYVLGQIRKHGGELVWCTQREDRVTVGVRSQTDWMGWVSRGWGGYMVVKFCEPEELDRVRNKRAKPHSAYRYRVTRRVGDAYDTFQRFRPLDDLDAEESPADEQPVPH